MSKTSKAVQEIQDLLNGDTMATFVVGKYVTWRGGQKEWRDNMLELRNYIFQTDTTQTSNTNLPWKNKTSIPKICQIRDNLHANYASALFPHDNWFKWEAEVQDDKVKADAVVIEGYMKQKIRESGFKKVMRQALFDYIDYGNAHAEVTYETETHTGPDGMAVTTYSGPRAHRLSPYDHVYDLSADNYKNAGKITRRVMGVGTLVSASANDPAFHWVKAALAETVGIRKNLAAYGDGDLDKAQGVSNDGFGSLRSYYTSDTIEFLEYEGDLYDSDTGEFQENRRVIIMDRRKVVLNEPTKSWLGRSNKEHVAWRARPDNLSGMGPLDNLVGLQYRLDHLENLKADVFDQIAHPVVYTKGSVEEWTWGPGEVIVGDVDSDVEVLSPDSTALNANFEMEGIMRKMEEMAGAPREAMGIRTPGEKTAFEFQALENAAGRIFQEKILQFEEDIVEPILNQMLEAARRNIEAPEIVKIQDEDFGVAQFTKITPDTINKKGKLHPIGARHFAKQAQLVQNLTTFSQTALYADPAVSTHISGLGLAKLMEENLGLEEFALVSPNIRVAEAQASQSLQASADEQNAEEVLGRNETEPEVPEDGQ
jgi:hypothetical protein